MLELPIPRALLALMGSLAGPLICSIGHAGEVLSSQVERHGGRFDIFAEMLIDLPEPEVRTILSRYENLSKINKGIKEVRILEPHGPDQARMKVFSEVCFYFICLDYAWIQDVNTLPSGEIVAIIDPRYSNFQEGRALWRLTAEDSRTRIRFDAHLVPDFWFPPIIGAWLIGRSLRTAALNTVLGVERVAADKGQEKP